MKIIVLLLALVLSPNMIKAQFRLAYSHPKTETIFYDTSKVGVHLSENDTLIFVKVLGIKQGAFKAVKHKRLRDIPLKYVQYYEYWQGSPADVGTCSFRCSRSFYPVFMNLVAKKIEETQKAIEERERFIEKHFPAKGSE